MGLTGDHPRSDDLSAGSHPPKDETGLLAARGMATDCQNVEAALITSRPPVSGGGVRLAARCSSHPARAASGSSSDSDSAGRLNERMKSEALLAAVQAAKM